MKIVNFGVVKDNKGKVVGEDIQSFHFLPQHLSDAYDNALSSLEATRASIKSWSDSQVAMQMPASASGSVICTSVGQSGRTYQIPEQGGALIVEQRDMKTFTALGATAVPIGAAPANPRAGTVFYDSSISGHMRFDGTNWAPVTLS